MKDFYIDFSEYPEAVASVLYEEVQKHAFELGSKWQGIRTTVVGYTPCWNVIVFNDNALSMWHSSCIPKPILDKVSVEEFLKMEKEPEYHVGMPMSIDDCDTISVYVGEGDYCKVFKAIPIKTSNKSLEYTLCDQHMYSFWEPIDTSRIKVTII